MFIDFLRKNQPGISPVLLGIAVLAALMGSPPAAAQQGGTTLEVRVMASSDDAEESPNGSVSIESTDLELVLDRNNQSVGLRFNEIDIPQGANITTAYIQFQVSQATSDVTSLTIEGEAADNAATFTTDNLNVSSRPRTGASMAWLPEPWLIAAVAGPNQKTPNIASIVQEIIVRPGWASGNSLAIIISGSGKRIAESYDGLPYAAPLLHVEYTLGGNLNPTTVIGSPLNSATFNQGDIVTFTGTADDFEDGNVTSGMSWASDLDGVIGTGGSVSTSDLSVGLHTITATATDRTGLTSFVTTTVTVFAPTPVLVGAGDIAYDGLRDEETAKLLDKIPGIVFTLGDNAYPKGRTAEFNAYYEPSWGRHKARTRPAIGNHEYRTPGAYGYFNYFGAAAGDAGRGYYSYDLGDWHIIVLNSECDRLGGCGADTRQGQWLQADLAENPGICTLAYFHNPLFSSSTSFRVPEVKDFWTLLYNAEVDVILNGSAHNYERFALQDPDGTADPARGIRVFVVGTGGVNFTPFDMAAPNSEARNSDTAGVLKLTLNSSSYDWEFIPIAGNEFSDAGSADCVTSSLPSETPTTTATSTKVDTPTEVQTETIVPTLTAIPVQISTKTSENFFQLPVPSCLAVAVPLIALVLLVRRQFRR